MLHVRSKRFDLCLRDQDLWDIKRIFLGKWSPIKYLPTIFLLSITREISDLNKNFLSHVDTLTS